MKNLTDENIEKLQELSAHIQRTSTSLIETLGVAKSYSNVRGEMSIVANAHLMNLKRFIHELDREYNIMLLDNQKEDE